MPALYVRLDAPVPETFAPELAKRLYFISAEIEGFTLVRRDGAVEAVDLAVAAGADAGPGLAEKINQVVLAEILPQRAVPVKVRWRSPAAVAEFTDAFAALVRDGAVFESGEGQVGFGEPVLGLLDHLDRRLRAIALSRPGAREYRYPTLLPTEVLHRFGYFGSFPQFVMFVTRLHNDIDVYDSFVKDYTGQGRVPADLFARCGNDDYCLPPTMCYHTYHQYRDRPLDGEVTVTARGKAFRYESRYHRGLERLWDFTIREMVFLGDVTYATEAREDVLRRSLELMEELELAGTCEVANDHFFADGDTANRIFSQRLMELKYELLLPVAADRSIAVGSFNLHGSFFGEAFGIALPDGRPAASACVGFGLERLAYAFLCQHGVDPRGWPATVRRDIGQGAGR